MCLWSNYNLFIAEYWLELHTCKLCVLLTIPMLHKLERTSEHNTRWWIFVIFCGNPLLCSIAVSLTPDWALSLSLMPSLGDGYTGLLNKEKVNIYIYIYIYIFVLFCEFDLSFLPSLDDLHSASVLWALPGPLLLGLFVLAPGMLFCWFFPLTIFFSHWGFLEGFFSLDIVGHIS